MAILDRQVLGTQPVYLPYGFTLPILDVLVNTGNIIATGGAMVIEGMAGFGQFLQDPLKSTREYAKEQVDKATKVVKEKVEDVTKAITEIPTAITKSVSEPLSKVTETITHIEIPQMPSIPSIPTIIAIPTQAQTQIPQISGIDTTVLIIALAGIGIIAFGMMAK